MGVYVLIKELRFGPVLLPAGSNTPDISDRKAEWLHDQGAIVLPGRKQVAVTARFDAPRSQPQRSNVRRCCGWR